MDDPSVPSVPSASRSAPDTTDAVDKAALRRRLIAERRAMADRPERSHRLDDVLRTWLAGRSETVIGAYWPIKGEFDVLPALVGWRASGPGRRIGLPLIDRATNELRFHEWYPGCPMRDDAYGIPTPSGSDRLDPELLVVPCVGFGPGGVRLGYGGGFYDRTLAAALAPRPRTLGVGFAHGFVPGLASEPHDIALDELLTEDGLRRDLDALWDFDDVAASGARFRAAIDAAEASGDGAAADEARTQMARVLGLLARFEDGDTILDEVDAAHPAEDRVGVRSRLERGRLRRSSGDVTSSIEPFLAAWDLARTIGEDGLAVDAAHMLAIVDAPPGETTWHERALSLAEVSPDPAARRWRGSLWNNMGWARFGTSDATADLVGALAAFETALAARREQGKPKETRIAEWCVARCLRALGRTDEALAILVRIGAEAAAVGDPEDGDVSEETGECLLALGRAGEARPQFARAAVLLGEDAGLAEQEPARIARLRELGGG